MADDEIQRLAPDFRGWETTSTRRGAGSTAVGASSMGIGRTDTSSLKYFLNILMPAKLIPQPECVVAREESLLHQMCRNYSL
ncbi:hypothetical protein I7I48_01930 [Histoplasma ohiense]|nr:hypothetical protein I7I48_01930 [Histoplasma ohiense (nom. inval.)]